MGGTLPSPGARKIIVIDALDECEEHDERGKSALLRCIRDNFIKLPSWLCFFVTSRPGVNIMKQLKNFRPIALEASSEENMPDVRRYIRDHLQGPLPEAMLD